MEQPAHEEGPHPHDRLRGLDRHHRHRRDPLARERREQLHRQRRGGNAFRVPAFHRRPGLRHDEPHDHGHGRPGQLLGQRGLAGRRASRWHEQRCERRYRRRVEDDDRHVRQHRQQRPRQLKGIPGQRRFGDRSVRELHRVRLQHHPAAVQLRYGRWRATGQPRQVLFLHRVRIGHFHQRHHVLDDVHQRLLRDAERPRSLPGPIRRRCRNVAAELQRHRARSHPQRQGERLHALHHGAARSQRARRHGARVCQRGRGQRARRLHDAHVRPAHGRDVQAGRRHRLLPIRLRLPRVEEQKRRRRLHARPG